MPTPARAQLTVNVCRRTCGAIKRCGPAASLVVCTDYWVTESAGNSRQVKWPEMEAEAVIERLAGIGRGPMVEALMYFAQGKRA